MFRLILGFVALLGLAACGADQTYDSPEKVAAARYVAGPPTSITLYTVINDRSGSSAHSGLLVNASQRVLFDPAGTWYHPRVPIQHDVHYGMTDEMVAFYLDYHARDSATEKFSVIEQTLILPPEIAELVLHRVIEHGSVPKALCANSVSDILRGVPGLESLPRTWFPKALGEAFGKIPGVTQRLVTEANDNLGQHNVILKDKDGNRVN